MTRRIEDNYTKILSGLENQNAKYIIHSLDLDPCTSNMKQAGGSGSLDDGKDSHSVGTERLTSRWARLRIIRYDMDGNVKQNHPCGHNRRS